MQRGTNRAGVNSGITLPGYDGVINCDTYTWDFSVGVPDHPRFGRGSAGVLRYRPLFMATNGSLKAKFALSGAPAPETFIGVRTTLVHQIALGKTVSIPIEITGYGPSYDVNKDDHPWLMLNWRATGAPVFDGWDDLGEVEALTKTDQQQYGGTQIGHDPQGINPPQTVLTIDWWASDVDDTNAGEFAKLVEVMADAIVPATVPHEYKQRGGAIIRNASDGGTATIYYGLTDTADDVINPRETQNDDSSNLEDSESIATIEDEDTHTPAPAPTGLKLIDTRREKLNDSRWVFTDYYGRRTREEAIEFDGSPATRDASSLVDAYSTTSIEANGTYNPPSAQSGYVLRDALIIQIHDASTGAKWRHRYDYARINRQKEMEYAGTRVQVEYSADDLQLGLSHTITWVTTTDVPTDVPGGAEISAWGISGQLVYTDSQPLTTSQGSYTGYWRHVFHYGPNTRIEEIENQGFYAREAASDATLTGIGIGDTDTQYVVTTSSAAPSVPVTNVANLKVVRRQSRRIQVEPERYEWRFDYARNTREDELEHTSRSVDASLLKDQERHPILHTSGTSSPGTPTPVNTSLVLVDTRIDRLVIANSNTGLWLWTFDFGWNTREDELEKGGKVIVVDQSGNVVSGHARVPVVETDDTPDGGVTVSGLQLIDIEKRELRTGKWLITYIFGQNTHEEDIELDGTVSENDPSNLTDQARVTLVNNSSTYPGALDTPPTVAGVTLKLRRIVTRQSTVTSGRWVHVGIYSQTNEEDDLEYGGSHATGDVVDGAGGVETTVVAHTGTEEELAATALTANQNDPTFGGVTVQKLTPALAAQKILREGGDKKVTFGSPHTVVTAVRGVPEGAIVTLPSGNTVYLPGNISLDDDDAWLYINFNYGDLYVRPQFISRSQQLITLRRIFVTDDYHEDGGTDYFNMAIKGKVNDDTFVRFLRGELMYIGPISAWSFELGGHRRLMVDYLFEHDNWKHFSDALLAEGTTYVNTGSIASSGVYLSSQFEEGYGPIFPPEEDFDGFLTLT